jgi:hypothetical protein
MDGLPATPTGSPFEPVTVAGVQRVIGQCNNCFLFPGLGLASVAVGAREVSEEMIDAALEALALAIPAANDPQAPLMPPLTAVQAVSRAVAELVRDHLPADVTLHDVGTVQLRGLTEPDLLFQVVHPALRRDFPALRSLAIACVANDDWPNQLPKISSSPWLIVRVESSRAPK